MCTEEGENPDLRNRGYIYWRMLASDPEVCKQVVMGKRPPISDDSGCLEPHLLDKLIDNIGMLSSVYYKPPEMFVKKIRDRINERLDLENEDSNQQVQKEEYVDSLGVKRSEYIKDSEMQNYHNYIQGSADLLGLDEEDKESHTNAIDDLLGMNNQMAQK